MAPNNCIENVHKIVSNNCTLGYFMVSVQWVSLSVWTDSGTVENSGSLYLSWTDTWTVQHWVMLSNHAGYAVLSVHFTRCARTFAQYSYHMTFNDQLECSIRKIAVKCKSYRTFKRKSPSAGNIE